MIKIENVDIFGFDAAVRGMRNPMNSWDKSDSDYCANCMYSPEHCAECTWAEDYCDCDQDLFNKSYILGPNDYELAMKLAKAGKDHRKFMRMIIVWVDITAPLYW